MTFADLGFLVVTCLVTHQPLDMCLPGPTVAGKATPVITFTGESTDVVLSAQAALAWDLKTGRILYRKNEAQKRPVASLTKLVAVMAARRALAPEEVVEIPSAVRAAQRTGAHVRLPAGEHITVQQLFESGLIASAADSMVTLAVAAKGSEEAFATYANQVAEQVGLTSTRLANATGLSSAAEHPQYSTAEDLRVVLETVYSDPLLAPLLAQRQGTLVTVEGTKRAYRTTNKLLGSYLPVLAGKTGYTTEAGGNFALITEGNHGQKIGIIILGSEDREDRFHNAQVLLEWLNRNYTWNSL